MRKKRILQFIGSFEQGGSEGQAVQLSKDLVADGTYEVFLACLNRSGPLLSRVDWMEPSEIAEFPLTSFYDSNFLRNIRMFGIYSKTHKIDVVHTHDFYSNIFGLVAAKFGGVRNRIGSKREIATKTSTQFLVERQAFRLAQKIVVNAEAVGRFLTANNVPSKKIVTIYNGVEIDRVQTPASFERSVHSTGIGIPTGAKVVTIVANMHDEVKNHKMFLRAARTVQEQIPNSVFVLAGEGCLEPFLRSFAEEMGISNDCRFLGSCSDIPQVLALTDVGVLCSRSEGFSNAIIEYMTAGLPVVATSVGGAGEAIVDGQTGYLVPSDDHVALAQRLISLLREEGTAKRFGESGRAVALAKFSSPARLSATLKLYDNCLMSN